MSLESAQQILNQAIRTGKSEFMRKFGLPSSLSRSVRDCKFQHSLNDLESFRDVLTKGVKESMANCDLSNGGLNQVCAVIDENIEKCKHRFIKAYSRFPTYNSAEQWEEFLKWMEEFRAGVRSDIMAAIEEDAEEDVEEDVDYELETSALDNREITGEVFKKYGYSDEVNELMHDLVLAVTAGETEDVKTAMDLFLTKFSDEAKRKLRNILDNKNAELKEKKSKLDELECREFALNEWEKQDIEVVAKTYETQNNLMVEAYTSQLEESRHRIEELEMLLQFSENRKEDLQERIRVHFENARETARINRIILSELEKANEVADRRLETIVATQKKLTAALAREDQLFDAVKRLRKTKRRRRIKLNLCTNLSVCEKGNGESGCDDSDFDEKNAVENQEDVVSETIDFESK